jgi:hypothetical protein
MSIDAQENELSDGVKIANNSCEKIISSGKRWELSHQPIIMLLSCIILPIQYHYRYSILKK